MTAQSGGSSARRVTVLGSTGTIGRLTLDVISRLPDRLEVKALAGWRNVALLAEQTLLNAPDTVAIGDPAFTEEAHFYLGKAYLRRRDVGLARQELQSVVAAGGRLAGEAGRLLKLLE